MCRRFSLDPTEQARRAGVLAVGIQLDRHGAKARHQGVARGWHRVGEAVAAGNCANGGTRSKTRSMSTRRLGE